MQVSNLVIRLVKLIDTAVQRKKSEQEILKKVRDVIQGVPEFNIREKARAYLAVQRFYQAGWKPSNMQIKKLCTSMNKINERSRARDRKNKLTEMLKASRANKSVFYLCSTHSNPAPDHADYQGLIYVDRFWRRTLADDTVLLNKVAAYIKNHSCLTVQEICRGPVYLITRPYCKHFFIPVSIYEVLHSSTSKVRKNHPEAVIKKKNINYRKKYYKMRYRIHKALDMKGESNHDMYLINKTI